MSEPLSRAGDLTPSGRPDDHVSPTGRAGFSSVLRNRNFLSIWTAQLASQTAQNSLWYVLIILVGHLTGQTPAGIGFTIVLVQIPTVLFSSVSGVLVDRVSKRSILIGTNVIRVGGVLLYMLFESNVGGLYLVTFLVAVVSQPFAPAEGSTLPLLVEGDQLITANSLFQTTFMASQAVGFALAPIALGIFGTRNTLIGLSVLFAFAAVVLIPLPAVTRRHAPVGDVTMLELARHVWNDLREVMSYIIQDPPLAVALFQIALAPTLLLVLAEVGPDFLTHTLHVGQTSTALFFLLAPAGLGLGIGLLILGHWGYKLRKDRLVLVALIALGVTVIGLASVPTLAEGWQAVDRLGWHVPHGVRLTLTTIPITVLMGVEVAFINAPVQTIVQQRARPEIRGRVLAMQQTLTAAMAIPPLVLIGGIAALIGTPATLSLTGVFLLIIGLATVYYA
ncbi:MAG TPA: MFS transporter [Chloroflexota bacterium]|nr:MFS transporter [Chloroflexota bacterium]